MALVCADSSCQIIFLKDYEDTLIKLWTIFKNSTKKINTYSKTVPKLHGLDNLCNKKHKNVAGKVKNGTNVRMVKMLNGKNCINGTKLPRVSHM